MTTPHSPSAPGDPTTALRLTGTDALALLHRISTNALLDMPPGRARPTLFCDFRGRLLHRAIVARIGDAVWLLREDAPGSELASFLDRHVFREQIRIEDRSGQLAFERVPAPQEAAGSLHESAGVPERVVLVGGEAWILPPAAGRMAPRSEDGERRRIAAGRPAHRHEIAEEFNPYEVGLGDEVHLDKGCYTGQEALQRLVTYDSVRRRLARVAGHGPVPATPCDVTAAGQRVGRLTSAAADPGPDTPGRWIGLAVIKPEVADSDHRLEVDGVSLAAPPRLLESPRPLGRP